MADLEKNIKNILGLIDEVKNGIESKTSILSEKLKSETQERKQEYKELNSKLEATETGGLDISVMGALWLFIGVIFSTAPTEISAFLQ